MLQRCVSSFSSPHARVNSRPYLPYPRAHRDAGGVGGRWWVGGDRRRRDETRPLDAPSPNARDSEIPEARLRVQVVAALFSPSLAHPPARPLHQVSTHSCTAVLIEQFTSLPALLPPPIASLALPNAMDLIFWRLESGFRGATYLLEVGDQVRQ